ncbi:DUF5701 family protein [Rhodococcus sp. AG1013]|uniref:DUF5701 family protein n=1 Tax=unclassified Rhodococcus (in: high G+C Gram-positive bacteria) TaxID=192944 RepID=UPI000E0BE530|nr:DUF5701 family protein [Rhodococcus sp. AG1013]RDI28214.1 hypothetical protein DEU38_107186 [Rhodococcus sp. AG1013]
MSDALAEFDRQLDHLVRLGYPALAGRSESAFRDGLAPLRDVVAARPDADVERGEDHIPFVLVPTGLPRQETTARTALGKQQGFTVLEAGELTTFRPIEGVDVPDGPGYLLFDIDTGTEFLNVTPQDALVKITGDGRSPLTIDEGIALVTARPDMLRKNKCFSLLASRCGDKRVPALWISDRKPKLGWCWNGNPHTWLGSAHAGERVGL